MQKLQAGKAAKVDSLSLIPLFLVQADSIGQPDFLWLNAVAEPFAVVVIEPGSVRALGVDGQELALAPLRQQIPELDAALNDRLASLKTSN